MAAKNQYTAANQMTFDLSETSEMLYEHFTDEASSGDVIHMDGAPGVGKSSIVKQTAERMGAKLVTFMAAQRAREDLVGPPYLIQPEDKDNALNGEEPIGYTKFYPPKTMLRLTKQWTDQQRKMHEARVAALKSEGKTEEAKDMGEFEEPGKVIFFLDEFANAPADVQTVYHSLILDRNFGDDEYELRDDVVVIAASNRSQDGAMIHKMSAPLATRMTHIHVSPTLSAWLDWARQADIYEPIRAFLKGREQLLGLAGIDVKIKSEAQPTPRSWEKASNKCRIKAYQIHPGDSQETKSRKARRLQGFIEGCVGAGATAEFMKFMEFAREAPSAEKISQEWKTLDTFDNKPDIALVAVENMLSGVKRNAKWVQPFLGYSKRMHQQYRQLFETELMNLNGTMSEEVINEVLENDNFEVVTETAARMNSAIEKGDNMGSKMQKRKRS